MILLTTVCIYVTSKVCLIHSKNFRPNGPLGTEIHQPPYLTLTSYKTRKSKDGGLIFHGCTMGAEGNPNIY